VHERAEQLKLPELLSQNEQPPMAKQVEHVDCALHPPQLLAVATPQRVAPSHEK